jgi:hypothetical protein
MGITFGKGGNGHDTNKGNMGKPVSGEAGIVRRIDELMKQVNRLIRDRASGKDTAAEEKRLQAELDQLDKDLEKLPRRTSPTDKWVLEHPERWTHKGKLPMRGKNKGYGVVFSNEVHTVYFANLFSREVQQHILKGVKKHAYPNIDAMLADGWMVDD